MERVPDELPLGRLEAFSDGVFAIAITLLVLELSVSHGRGRAPAELDPRRVAIAVAYLTSFMTIGVIWLQHAAITGALRAADATLYRLNLLVLLLVGFIPFPTKLVSEFIDDYDAERVAVVFYGLTLLALALALTAFVRYAAENPRLVEGRGRGRKRRSRTRPSAGLPLLRDRDSRRLLLPEVGVALFSPHRALRWDPGRTSTGCCARGVS